MAFHRVLIVGTGSIGERHVRCFAATGRAHISVCEVDGMRRRAVADRYGVNRSFGDLSTAMEAGCDAAVIATPAPLHVPIATQLAEAGAHVLIEKPLSTNFDGIARLEQTVAARGIIAAVAYVYRAHPALQAMRQAIGDGRFGRLVQIVAVSGQHFPTYRPAYRSIYYNNRVHGGGAIQDALTHLLNAGEFLAGPIDRVMADASHQVLEGVEVEDTAHVLARHGNILGCYCLNQYQAPDELTITVIGDRGTARFEMHKARWRSMAEPGGAWHEQPESSRERDAIFNAQAHAFLDAIERKARPLCTLADGIQTLRVNLAVLAASSRPDWREIQRQDSIT